MSIYTGSPDKTAPARLAIIASLKNMDFVVLVDKSRSMDEPIAPGKPSKWLTMEETLTGLTKELAVYDDDGITVVPFGPDFGIEDGVTPDKVAEVFQKYQPDGGTYLAPPLQAVIDKFIPAQFEAAPAKKTGILRGLFGGSSSPAPRQYKPYKPQKPVFILVATDGAASDPEAVTEVIVEATRRITDRSALGILFTQVGNARMAERFLNKLNNDLGPAGALHDIVAVCKLEDIEDLKPEDIVLKAFTE